MPRETLVLLPGMMCDARLFSPQMGALQDRFEIIVPRLKSASIEAMAKGVLQEVEEARFSVAGLSMGGIVAMEMASMAPERIERLALLDTNHLADAPGRFEIRNRQISDVRAGHLRDVIVDEMKPVYLAHANRGNQALLDLLVAMALDCGADMFAAQSLALRDRADQSASLAAFKGPTLVHCGAEDELCPPERHREIAGLLENSELAIVPGAGHISTLENPAAVTAGLEAWLTRPVG